MDVAFVIDDTPGSMDVAIAYVRNEVEEFSEVLNFASGGDFRMSIVSFGHWSSGTVRKGLEVSVDVDYTNNIAPIRASFNDRLRGAFGGGLQTEPSDEALNLVVSGAAAGGCTVIGTLSAARAECLNIAILVTSDRPGGCDDSFVAGVDDVNAASVATTAARNGWHVSVIDVLDGFTDAVSTPIMQNYAATTGGSYTSVPFGVHAGAAISSILETCGIPSCGDGTLDPSEECDDGNRVGGDCCSGACTVEEPPDCTPCGHNDDKTQICHVQPENSAKQQTICISPTAVCTHLNQHGDFCGPCE